MFWKLDDVFKQTKLCLDCLGCCFKSAYTKHFDVFFLVEPTNLHSTSSLALSKNGPPQERKHILGESSRWSVQCKDYSLWISSYPTGHQRGNLPTILWIPISHQQWPVDQQIIFLGGDYNKPLYLYVRILDFMFHVRVLFWALITWNCFTYHYFLQDGVPY